MFSDSMSRSRLRSHRAAYALALAVIGLALTASSSIAAAAFAQSPIRVSDAWARPAISSAVVYMKLRNTGNQVQTLIDAETPIAQSIEIHRSYRTTTSGNEQTGAMSGMEMSGMAMKDLSSVAIAAGATVTFAPGGYHLMLVGLTHDLHLGESIPLTLIFKGGMRLHTTVHVLNR